MKKFDEDDGEYLAWIASHPNGFVVNSRRKPTAGYLVLHRSICPSIDGRVQHASGGYTERSYIKFASDNLDDLRSGLATIAPRFSGHCQRCDPLSDKRT